jgi:hypothetical protein
LLFAPSLVVKIRPWQTPLSRRIQPAESRI